LRKFFSFVPLFLLRETPILAKKGVKAQYLTIQSSVCATGALRIHYAHRVYYYTEIKPSPTYDISWEALGSWVSTAVEANVAIICASAPALNVYAKGWFGVKQYHERSFGWYGAGGHRKGLGRGDWHSCSEVTNTLHQEMLEGIAVPCRARSLESGASLGRQDSRVPILR
jgi:hypothetical protein